MRKQYLKKTFQKKDFRWWRMIDVFGVFRRRGRLRLERVVFPYWFRPVCGIRVNRLPAKTHRYRDLIDFFFSTRCENISEFHSSASDSAALPPPLDSSWIHLWKTRQSDERKREIDVIWYERCVQLPYHDPRRFVAIPLILRLLRRCLSVASSNRELWILTNTLGNLYIENNKLY